MSLQGCLLRRCNCRPQPSVERHPAHLRALGARVALHTTVALWADRPWWACRSLRAIGARRAFNAIRARVAIRSLGAVCALHARCAVKALSAIGALIAIWALITVGALQWRAASTGFTDLAWPAARCQCPHSCTRRACVPSSPWVPWGPSRPCSGGEASSKLDPLPQP